MIQMLLWLTQKVNKTVCIPAWKHQLYVTPESTYNPSENKSEGPFKYTEL